MMSSEHEPFLQPGRQKKWRSWDVMFYLLLFIPILVLFIFGQVLILGNNSTKTLLLPFNNHTHPLGFPMTTTGPVKPFSYNSLPPCDDVQLDRKVNTTTIWMSMKTCHFSLLQRFFGNPQGVLPNFASILYVCDETQEVSGIDMRELVAPRRPYYVALPKCKESSVLVNLGIDEDSSVLNQLKMTVENMKFYGTSPTAGNDKVFESVFPRAVSLREENVAVAKNEIRNRTEVAGKTVSFESYLNTELANLKFIDILWINLENGPSEFGNFLAQDDLFDKLGVTICQIGIEIEADKHNEFYGFMLSVLNQPRYIFMRPSMSADEQVVRVYLLNVVDEKCYKKYINIQ